MSRYLFLILLTATVACAEDIEPRSFFPVALDQEFPDAENTFHEVMDLILENYYTTEITEEALFYSAIAGMLRHVSPPENKLLGKLWKPADYDKVRNSLKGVQVSTGVKSTFSQQDGSLTVTGILPGSPAEGVLLPYDRILRINDEPLKGKLVSDIDSMMNGEVDTEVKLTIVRDVQVFDVVIKLKEFKTANLSVAVLPNEIGFVEIHKITAGITDELKNELDALQAKNVKKLILDLRDNTGGVFMESLRLAELFLANKSVLLRLQQRQASTKLGEAGEEEVKRYVSSNETPYDFEIVLLVNKNTASSCEIIAAALRDHKAATIVGAGTYGKSVIEKTYTLDNNYRCKFITGAMYTPRGVAWQSKGVLPDFSAPQDGSTYKAVAKLTPNQRLSKDVPLITAYKLLK